MKKLLVLSSLMFAVVLIASTEVTGQDKAKPKGKQLPANWGKLGLSDDQKTKIYAVQEEYGVKIAELQKQVRELTKKQNEEMAAVLTDDQKERLKKILTEKVPDAKKPDGNKKPTDKKPEGDKKPTDK